MIKKRKGVRALNTVFVSDFDRFSCQDLKFSTEKSHHTHPKSEKFPPPSAGDWFAGFLACDPLIRGPPTPPPSLKESKETQNIPPNPVFQASQFSDTHG